MARKKKRGSKKKDEKEKDFANLGSIIDGDNGAFIAMAEEYKPKKGKAFIPRGRILFEVTDEDSEKFEQIFELSTISIFDPNDKAPDNVLNNIVINLENENQCTDVTDEFDD